MRRALLAEAFGTFLLVAIGCSAAAWDAIHGGLGTLGVAVAFGLVVCAMVQLVGPISGAHLNPVVTLAFWGRRDIGWRQAGAFVLVQGVAAVLGALVVLAWAREHIGSITTRPVAGMLLGDAFLLELAVSAVLVLTILLVAVPPRVPQWCRAIAIGLAVLFGAWVAGPLTGGSMNPARTIGPAIVAGDLGGLWLYMAAPASGSLLALAVHTTLARLRTRIKTLQRQPGDAQ